MNIRDQKIEIDGFVLEPWEERNGAGRRWFQRGAKGLSGALWFWKNDTKTLMYTEIFDDVSWLKSFEEIEKNPNLTPEDFMDHIDEHLVRISKLISFQ